MKMLKAVRSLPATSIPFLLLAAGLMVLAPGADAGQRRVEVGFGGNNFQPDLQTLNLNDHVTWVWVTGLHTVTNGSDPSDPNLGQDFDSGFLNGTTTPQALSWQCDVLGTIPYFCQPHYPTMLGSLQVSASGVNVWRASKALSRPPRWARSYVST